MQAPLSSECVSRPSAGHECRGMSPDILTCHLLLSPADLGGLRGGGRGFTHCRRCCCCCCCLGHFHLRFGGWVWRFLLTQLKLAAELLVLTVQESEWVKAVAVFHLLTRRYDAELSSLFITIKICPIRMKQQTRAFFFSICQFQQKLHSLPVRTFIYFFLFYGRIKKKPERFLCCSYLLHPRILTASLSKTRTLSSLTLRASSGICISPRTTVNRLVCEQGSGKHRALCSLSIMQRAGEHRALATF